MDSGNKRARNKRFKRNLLTILAAIDVQACRGAIEGLRERLKVLSERTKTLDER